MAHGAEPDQHLTGRHMLGPHVEGQRVVIRSLVPGESGPTGGPAFTDVLGVCVTWGDPVVVRREDGTTVEIPRDRIVSGKPVPPRPSVRDRVSAREAEGHGFGLFPGMETHERGEWVLRTDPAPVGRLVKRANSCLAMGRPDRPLRQAVTAVREFYEERERQPLAQVRVGSEADAAFVAEGWRPVPGGDSLFQLVSVAMARRTLRALRPDTARLTLAEDGPRFSIVVDDLPVGVPGWIGGLQGVVSGDWLGLRALRVAPEHRRRGWALALTSAALDLAAEQGCGVVWLHVETDHEPALALYERLGFRTHHACRYLAG